MTMSAVADWLTGAGDLDRPIADQTGLNGTYDFVLEFDPASEEDQAATPPTSNSAPTFAQALNDQLGMQLKKEKGTATIFVVDSIRYPSPN